MNILLCFILCLTAQAVQAIPVVFEQSTGKIVQVGYADTKELEQNPDVRVKDIPEEEFGAPGDMANLSNFKIVNGSVKKKTNLEKAPKKNAEKARRVIDLKLKIRALQALQVVETDKVVQDELVIMVNELMARLFAIND